jgi:hypothetical protein
MIVHHRCDLTRASIASRIGPDSRSHATITFRKSASINADSSHLKHPECSASAARASWHFSQAQAALLLAAELQVGSNPMPSALTTS